MMQENFKKLISIPSHSGNEELIAKYLVEEVSGVSQAHTTVVHQYSDQGRNVLVLSKKRTKLLIDVHLDTVSSGDVSAWQSDSLCLIEREEKLFGLGTADVKSGLAICLELLKTFDCSEVSFAFCGGEETGGQGLKFALKSNLLKGIPLVIVMEPTELNVGIAHKGCYGAQITFEGRSAHASTPWLGDNAIMQANRFLNAFQELFPNWKQNHGLLGETTFNVGTIQGGSTMNIVPDRCSLGIDMRLVPGQTAESAQYFLNNVIEKIVSRCTMSTRYYPSMEYSGSEYIIRMLLRVAGGTTKSMPYWSHGGLYQQARIPTFLFGPGSIDQAHQPNEFVSKDRLDTAFQALASIIQTL